MVSLVQSLLAIESAELRQRWLVTHCPQKDEVLIHTLREESYVRERENPSTVLVIAQILYDLATLWDDQYTYTIGLIIDANARRHQADYAASLEKYQQARQLAEILHLTSEIIRVMVGQIDTMMYLGRYEEALQVADDVIARLHGTDDHRTLAKTFVNRGNILSRLGRYTQAQQDYQKARSIFDDLGAKQDLAMVAANEANLLTNLNDFRLAESMYRQAGEYFAQAGLANAVAQIDHNLAYLYYAQGNYQRAFIQFNQARTAFLAQDSQIDVAYVDLYRCEIYLTLNLWGEALELARAVRPLFETAKMRWESAQLWLVEAAALAHADGAAITSEALTKARQLFTEENNLYWLAIVDLYQATFNLRSHDLVSARLSAQRAHATFHQLAERNRTAQCETILGEIAFVEQNIAQAEQHFSYGLALLGEVDLPAVSFACHYGLGRVYRQRGQLSKADKHLQTAISAIERLQAAIGAEDYKIAFRSDKLQVYHETITLNMSIDDADAHQTAFETIERAKSRAMLDALAHVQHAGATASPETPLLIEMEQLRQELNWLYSRMNLPEPSSGAASAPESLAQLTAAITQREQALKTLLNRWRAPDLVSAPHNPISTATLPHIQAILPAGALLLAYYFAEKQLIVFGVTHTGMWTQQWEIAHESITDLLGQLQFQLNKFGLGPIYRQRHARALLQGAQAILQQLYLALVQPITHRLEAEQIMIVPHGLLHSVPFHALFDGERYLIQTKAISYAPSATILCHILSAHRETDAAPPLILGITDGSIPYAQPEAEALGALFPQAHVYVSDQASAKRLFEARRLPSFMHIATHATFRSDNPLFSALKFADGWVTVNDLYMMMQRSAPLVTLSACETGQNRLYAGDELMGLCRGFLRAGGRSLVVSQWMVDDHSTIQLMTHFYRALQQGQPVQQALRSAQLAILESYEHPYYWAPFTLTGDPWLTIVMA